MDSRIGPSAASHDGFFTGEYFDRFFDRDLDTHSVGLPLPADEVGAIIANRDFESAIHHRIVMNL